MKLFEKMEWISLWRISSINNMFLWERPNCHWYSRLTTDFENHTSRDLKMIPSITWSKYRLCISSWIPIGLNVISGVFFLTRYPLDVTKHLLPTSLWPCQKKTMGLGSSQFFLINPGETALQVSEFKIHPGKLTAGTWKLPVGKGKWSSEPWFLGPILIFRGVSGQSICFRNTRATKKKQLLSFRPVGKIFICSPRRGPCKHESWRFS